MRKTWVLGAVLLSLAGLAACVDESAPPTVSGETGQELLPYPPLVPDCPGGKIVVGMVGPTCTMPTPDAGKACKQASDCSGQCMAETMTCSKESPNFGCHEVVVGEGQTATLCVD